MKKLLFFSVVAACVSSLGLAGTITATCTNNPVLVPGTSGTATENCAWTGLPSGSTITAVTAVYGFDFLYNAGDASLKTVQFSFDAPGTSLDWGVSSPVTATDANGANPRPVTMTFNASGADLTNYFASGASFTINDAFQQTGGTGVAAGIFNKTVTASYSTSGTPEPATLSLLGLGLVAIGFGSRKIRQ